MRLRVVALGKRTKLLLALGVGSVAIAAGWLVYRKIHRVLLVPAAPSRSMSADTALLDAPTKGRERLRVYFVGHSLINNDMPQQLVAIAASRGVEVSYESQLIDGGSLKRNWEEPETASHHTSEGADEGNEASTAADTLREPGRFDALVITEAVNLDDSIRWSEPETFAAAFFGAALVGNPEAQLFFYETWHHRDQPRRIDMWTSDLSWREHLDADLDKWEHIVDGAQSQIASPIHIVPGGQAMAALSDAIADGRLPELNNLDAAFADNVHLSPIGNYFIALIMFATLTGVDPVGATTELRSRETVLSPELGRALQLLARDVVSNYPRAFARP